MKLNFVFTCFEGKKDFAFVEEVLTEPKIPDLLLIDMDDPKSDWGRVIGERIAGETGLSGVSSTDGSASG